MHLRSRHKTFTLFTFLLLRLRLLYLLSVQKCDVGNEMYEDRVENWVPFGVEI
jgi:hypothetical protein